jgi:uncharacterized membrane protein
MVSLTQPRKRPTALAIFLIIAGGGGLSAAWALTVDKFEALIHPAAALGCDFSLIVRCKVNLDSAQGSVFGFPNPMLGLAGFVAPIAVGAGILAGAKFARWFWILFNLGVAGALAFVIWLIGQSIYVLGTLCPWCMVVWAVTIPLFLAVTFYNLSTGNLPIGQRMRHFGKVAYGWVPLVSVVCYIVIAVLAQLRLDVTGHIFL